MFFLAVAIVLPMDAAFMPVFSIAGASPSLAGVLAAFVSLNASRRAAWWGCFVIAALHRRINFVFARTQHAGIRARIRGRDRSAGSASAPKHAYRIGNDICVVAGREFGVGIYLERPRLVA